jgi:hypothetical protein
MDKVRQIDGKLIAKGTIFEDAPTRIPMEARRVKTYFCYLYNFIPSFYSRTWLTGLLQLGRYTMQDC